MSPILAEVLVLAAVLALLWPTLGSYIADVYDGRAAWCSFIERPLYRLLGVRSDHEQGWRQYSTSLLVFSGVSLLSAYAVMRLQGFLPLNPQGLPPVSPALAWNTAASFLTTADWQAYVGEQTMSYLSQMAALTTENFTGPAIALAVAAALARGFRRSGRSTVGNFWIDLVRGMLYLLLPASLFITVVLVSQGAVQTLGGPVTIHNGMTGFVQKLASGPAASMTAIEHLGDNGGGYFGANAAHPFANPSGLTNFVLILSTLAIPFAMTYAFGKMVGSVRQGAVLAVVMVLLFAASAAVTIVGETGANPAVAAAGVHQVAGNMVGKEARFGPAPSALYGAAATSSGLGASSSAYDSYTPLGAIGLLSGMVLGDVSPGGLGSGLFGLVVFAIVAVFLGGLMVGRTPTYMGKLIQGREIKLASVAILVMPLLAVVLTAVAVSLPALRSAALNSGPQGFTEILYAFVSMAVDNGSSLAGLSANAPFYNVFGGVAMLLGRYVPIVAVLGIAGSLAGKSRLPPDAGTIRTDTLTFTAILVSVVVVVGGLAFFGALALGPVAEALRHGRLLASKA